MLLLIVGWHNKRTARAPMGVPVQGAQGEQGEQRSSDEGLLERLTFCQLRQLRVKLSGSVMEGRPAAMPG